ncbi:MAG: hypothetical protein RLY72_2668 [Planctomycetota bacterium]
MHFAAVGGAEAGAFDLNLQTHECGKRGTRIFNGVACQAGATASNKWMARVDVKHEASAFNVRIGTGAAAFVVAAEAGPGFG